MKNRYSLDRNSSAYKRMTQAGFLIEDPIIEYCHNDCSVVSFTVRFRCVCDQYEQFGPVIFKSVLIDVFWPDGRIDFAQMLEESGAVSVEHLLKDGYSDIEISRIRGAYA